MVVKLSDREYREVIESGVVECERLSGIIENLLFLARAEASDGPVERKVFASRPAVQKIASYYESVAEEQGITLSLHGDGEIYADPLLFSRALGNLIENALRYTPAGGKIEIELQNNAGDSAVTVKDNGAGIEAQHMTRVFDRFYRVDSSRSSKGSGLGLALVKSIMDLHGGTVAMQSEPGRGTLVRLNFPHQTSTSTAVA
jgi:two-component system heavy metal sensor histidine kinase CusS